MHYMTRQLWHVREKWYTTSCISALFVAIFPTGRVRNIAHPVVALAILLMCYMLRRCITTSNSMMPISYLTLWLQQYIFSRHNFGKEGLVINIYVVKGKGFTWANVEFLSILHSGIWYLSQERKSFVRQNAQLLRLAQLCGRACVNVATY